MVLIRRHLMGLVADIAAGILRGAGHEDLADWVKDAPTKFGVELGRILQEGLKSDGSFTSEALTKLKDLRSTDTSQTPPSPPDLLSEYLADLNGLAALASAFPAVAVKGFFHNMNCLTLWHFTKQPHQSFKIENDPMGGPPAVWVYGSGTDIYIGPEIDDKLVDQFNVALEKDETDHPSALEDIKKLCESKVKLLTKNAVTLSPLSGRKDYDVEIENPKGIAEAIRTMDLAVKAQNRRPLEWAKNR
jgi:hypothetical protein